MLNDCISPVDLVRDWPLFRAGPVTPCERAARPGERRVRRSRCCSLSRLRRAVRAAGAASTARSFGGFLARHVVCAVERPLRSRRGAAGRGLRRARRGRGPRARPEPRLRARASGSSRSTGASAAESSARRRRTIPRSTPTLDRRTALRATAVHARSSGAAAASTSSTGSTTPTRTPTLAGSDRLWERSGCSRGCAADRGSRTIPASTATTGRARSSALDPDGSDLGPRQLARPLPGLQVARLPATAGCARTGWVRVSRGSHSGHVPFRSEPRWRGPEAAPGAAIRAQAGPAAPRAAAARAATSTSASTTGEGLRLVPLETLDHGRYPPLDPGVKPPWRQGRVPRPGGRDS